MKLRVHVKPQHGQKSTRKEVVKRAMKNLKMKKGGTLFCSKKTKCLLIWDDSVCAYVSVSGTSSPRLSRKWTYKVACANFYFIGPRCTDFS